MSNVILGSEEFIALPDLNLQVIRARIDSGAASSVIHAFNIKIMKNNNEETKSVITFLISKDFIVIWIC
jgi:ribosomal protein S6--L-glutamate ligase